jgi:hypothetical protein
MFGAYLLDATLQGGTSAAGTGAENDAACRNELAYSEPPERNSTKLTPFQGPHYSKSTLCWHFAMLHQLSVPVSYNATILTDPKESAMAAS